MLSELPKDRMENCVSKYVASENMLLWVQCFFLHWSRALTIFNEMQSQPLFISLSQWGGGGGSVNSVIFWGKEYMDENFSVLTAKLKLFQAGWSEGWSWSSCAGCVCCPVLPGAAKPSGRAEGYCLPEQLLPHSHEVKDEDQAFHGMSDM